LQQGVADFVIGSTINWSPQVNELNLFSLPFMFPSHTALDAVEAGEPGTRLFKLIEQRGAVPLAWGENGFREVTNSKRPIRRPEDLLGLKIRVPGVPILAETFQALGANPVTMNFDRMLIAVQQGTVDGQENPIALIVPYKLWEVHKYVTLWDYAIDPLILAVNAKTWASLSREDQNSLREVGKVIMGLQKDEARAAPVRPDKIVELLICTEWRLSASRGTSLQRSATKPALPRLSSPIPSNFKRHRCCLVSPPCESLWF
jgi:tripartite ATP-independent transporter DctP family solute receptor